MKIRRAGVVRLNAVRQRGELRDVLGIDLGALEDRDQGVSAHPPGADVGVERVDEGVRLGVVAEEDLVEVVVVDAGARRQQRSELVADLILEEAEATLQEVLQARLEREAVPAHPVQTQLGLEHLAHLLRAAAQDEDARRIGGAELAEQRRGPGDRALLARLFKSGAQQIPHRVELGAQVGLVQVPAVDHAGSFEGWPNGGL